ncbi:PhzF family phenazine biosynthesis protein [Formicincola oecophyllae]|uniref:PhzF family phenazine biosynthesis protein n=1 Tax=Formicincola oecophyllae TaxID=2558361 RepID=A0A4Y6U9P5_9PROT|nr:PhzF family phenazine biosynthesis protein [Formicincola oecophyllae]QDH13278.1 PhzF family phenazine biosynthesis protein [Formicincola oecophyllae]
MKPYTVVDAFSALPFQGNPVGVVLDAAGLTDTTMQAMARWTNLSETTFVLPPRHEQADYRLRIFTPRSELPFAGHPTLGTAHALVEAGLIKPESGKIIQECQQGLINITVEGPVDSQIYTLELPRPSSTTLTSHERMELEAILGAPILPNPLPARLDVGAVWAVAQVADVAALLNMQPDFQRMQLFAQQLGLTGVSVFANHGSNSANVEVRSFAPSCGVVEDPVCGSGNGCVAAFRFQHGLVPANHYEATQGQKLGRSGRLFLHMTPSGAIRLGGHCTTSLKGHLAMPSNLA